MTEQQFLAYKENRSAISNYKEIINYSSTRGFTLDFNNHETTLHERSGLFYDAVKNDPIFDSIKNDPVLQNLGAKINQQIILLLETKIKELETLNLNL